MYINGINFPNDIIDAINDGSLVVFVGAGASMGKPTLLPDFAKLTDLVATGTGKNVRLTNHAKHFWGDWNTKI